MRMHAMHKASWPVRRILEAGEIDRPYVWRRYR